MPQLISRVQFAMSLVLVFILSLFTNQCVYAQTSLSYYDGLITFEFAEDYTTGQYVNGDWWVHNNGDPIIITAITPVSRNADGRIINGTEVNPSNTGFQGYDSRSRDMDYDASLNLDPEITGDPLTLPAGSTVIKSVSMPTDAGRPIISDAAVLTVVGNTPAEGSFRPPYVGNDKTPPAHISQLNYDALGRFKRLASTPPISQYYEAMSRTWLDYYTEWRARDVHPSNHMPVYGRDIAKLTGEIALQLQLDYSNSEKQPALINIVQYGLDIFAISKQPGIEGGEKYWYNNGGHNIGRKLPLLLTAKVLNRADLLIAANADTSIIFQEDQQTFYLTQSDIDFSIENLAPERAYSDSDLGMPEWATRYYDQRATINKDWGARYRDVVGSALIPTVLATHLMQASDDWNWPALFDYADRYFQIEADQASNTIGGNEIHKIVVDLWRAYRDQTATPEPRMPENELLIIPTKKGNITVVPL